MLDTFTLYSIVVTTTLISAWLVNLYGRRTPEAVGVGAWVAGNLSVAVYFLCLMTRPWLPPFVSIALANGCIVAGLALIHLAACRITGREWPVAWHAAAFVVIVATFAVFLSDNSEFRIRVILSSIVTAAQATLIAFTFSRPDAAPGLEEQRARHLAAWVFFGIALMQIIRAIAVAPVTASLDPTLLSRNSTSYWSAAWFLVFSLALPFLITYMNEARVQHQLSRAVTDLQTALTEVKTLRGLLPICASCRRIREEDNRWLSIEQYLEAHSNVRLSHGVCPDCRTTSGPATGRTGA